MAKRIVNGRVEGDRLADGDGLMMRRESQAHGFLGNFDLNIRVECVTIVVTDGAVEKVAAVFVEGGDDLSRGVAVVRAESWAGSAGGGANNGPFIDQARFSAGRVAQRATADIAAFISSRMKSRGLAPKTANR